MTIETEARPKSEEELQADSRARTMLEDLQHRAVAIGSATPSDWVWDGLCTMCDDPVDWRGDPPETKEDALCDGCVRLVLDLAVSELVKTLENLASEQTRTQATAGQAKQWAEDLAQAQAEIARLTSALAQSPAPSAEPCAGCAKVRRHPGEGYSCAMHPTPVPAPLDVEAIRKRCDAATPGPWAATQAERNRDAVQITSRGYVIAELGDEVTNTDADFIATARTDVPDLCAEVLRLRALLDDAVIRSGVARGLSKHWAKEVDRLRAADTPADELRTAVIAYVERWSLEHDDGCPADDTCSCPLVRAVEKALHRPGCAIRANGRSCTEGCVRR